MIWEFSPASKPMVAIMREILRKYPKCEFGRELFPGNPIPILRVSGGKTTADVADWGYLTQKGKRVYNARSETLLEKPLFGKDFVQNRCVIPVTGFCEWDGDGTGWDFLPQEEEMLYLAGVCRKKAEGWEATVVTNTPQDMWERFTTAHLLYCLAKICGNGFMTKHRRGSFWKKPKNGYCSNGRRWKEKLYEYDISASQRISD